MAIKKKTSGSKLSRTEIVQVRLDPKLRYLAELAARKHRRTLSSFIEWAVESSLKEVLLKEELNSDFNISIADEAANLWDVDAGERLAKLAWNYPDLLTHEEQVLWKLIRDNGFLWKGHFDEQGVWIWNWKDKGALIFARLSQHWDDFVKVAQGDAGKEILPKWIEKGMPEKASNDHFGKPSVINDCFEDEIPF